MDDKVFPFFLWNEGPAAVWAAQFYRGKAAVLGREPGGADLAQELAFRAVIPVKEWFWSITAWAGAVIRDVTFRATADRTDLLTVAFFVVWDEFSVSPVLPEIGNKGEFVNFELLVFGGTGIIKSPLFERDISADKI